MIWRNVILMTCCAAAWAQLPSPQAAPPRIDPSLERRARREPEHPEKTEADLDAVAYDRQGRPITDLKAADFALSVNGTRQEIQSCVYKSGQPLRLVVIVDDRSLTADHNNAARRDLRALVERLAPADEMAVLHSSGGSGALDRFTSDRNALQAAITRAAYNPAADGSAPETLAGAFRTAVRGALEGLRDLPGRKAVLFISERLREPARGAKIVTTGLAGIANAASATLYIVDMTGAPDLATLDPGLSRLARDTGGVYFNGGTTADALAQIALDQSGYYLVRFHAGNLPYDFFAGAPRVERLGLDAARAPVLRTRNGLFGPHSADGYGAAEQDLSPSSALGRELVAGSLGAAVTGLAAMESSWHVNCLLHVDAKDIAFVHGLDGKYRASVDLVAALIPAGGGLPEDRVTRSLAVTTTEKGYRDARQWGLTYTAAIPITKPGSYELVVVAHDETSGSIGTARTSVAADWGADKLAMSSLTVHGETVKGASGENLQDPAESAVLRSFRPGRKIIYLYELFNLASDPEKRSRVEVRTRIWRDGSLVVETQPMPVAFDPAEAPGRRAASGSLALTQQTKAGRYILGVTVLDKLSGRSATRFMDFDVRP